MAKLTLHLQNRALSKYAGLIAHDYSVPVRCPIVAVSISTHMSLAGPESGNV